MVNTVSVPQVFLLPICNVVKSGRSATEITVECKTYTRWRHRWIHNLDVVESCEIMIWVASCESDFTSCEIRILDIASCERCFTCFFARSIHPSPVSTNPDGNRFSAMCHMQKGPTGWRIAGTGPTVSLGKVGYCVRGPNNFVWKIVDGNLGSTRRTFRPTVAVASRRDTSMGVRESHGRIDSPQYILFPRIFIRLVESCLNHD